MSAVSSPRELAELTVRRLNRAASDLGLTLRGAPLFRLLSYDIPADEVETDGPVNGDIEVYDIELTAEEFEDYAKLATLMEQLAERQVQAPPHTHTVGQQAFEIDA